jgi:mRNA interferase RelE/StbE
VNWQVEITRDAQKELSRLPSHMQTRIAKAVLALENNPFPHGCKKLKNRDGWRIRVGDYRVLYFADTKARQIVIGVIGHRREVYRN